MSQAQHRSFVIGDIHGCVDELNRMLDEIDPRRGDTLVFLGDYIDRGPQPKAVVDRLLRLRQEFPDCVFLKGNHEDMFLAYLGLPGHYGESFLYNGGESTLKSYGLERSPPHEIARQLPPDHLEFYRRLQLRYSLGEFLCVHAGVNPDRPLDAQDAEDLVWIRGPFIQKPHRFGITVLFGHTPCRDVLLDLPYKIGLDTGLVYGNRLSCFETSTKQLFQVRRGETNVVSHSLVGRFASLSR